MAKKQRKINNLISLLLVVAISIGLIGFLAYYTGGFTSGIKTFLIECEGEEIITCAGGFETTTERPLVVNVKYNFSNEARGYSVKVVPNALVGKDFDFKLDGEVYSFQAEKDLTDGFKIECMENSFTLTPKGGLTEIIQAVYPNKVVEDCVAHGYKDMFTMVVTSYNGNTSVYLNFCISEKVSGIEFEKGVIKF